MTGIAEHPTSRGTATAELFRASPVQEQMWLVDKLDPSAGVYNESLAFRLRGPLSPAALELAFTVMVRRHEALRTVLPVRDGVLHQRVVGPWTVRLPVRDFAGRPDAERALLEWARDLVERPYRPQDVPPLRIALGRVHPDEHVLVLGFHHGVADAGAVALLLSDAGAAYRHASVTDDPARIEAALPPVRGDYRTFVEWHADHLETPEHGRLLEEYSAELSGARQIVDVAPDRPRPAVKASTGSLAVVPLGDELVTQVRTCAAELRATPFAVLLAGFTAMLHRHTRSDDIVVGMGSAGRPEGFETTVGPFSCMVPLRVGTPGDLTFRELVERTRDASLTASERQFVPLSTLVESALVERDLRRNPLVQIVFNAPPLVFAPDTFDGCALSPVHLPRRRSRFDFLFNLDWSDGITATVEYDSGVFDEDTVERLVRHFASALEDGIARHGARLDDLVLAPPDGVADRTPIAGPAEDPVAAAAAAVTAAVPLGPDARLVVPDPGGRACPLVAGAREAATASGAAVDVDPDLDPTVSLPGSVTVRFVPSHGGTRTVALLPAAGGVIALEIERTGADLGGTVLALPVAARVTEPGGAAAVTGLEGDLRPDVHGADAGPLPHLRVRLGVDGRLRWRAPDVGDGRAAAVARPDSPLLGHVLDRCTELLGARPDGDDDFFVAGGHSMAAARLVQSLGDDFGVEIPLLLVFENPRLADLAAAAAARHPEIEIAMAELADMDEETLAEMDAQSSDDPSDSGDPSADGGIDLSDVVGLGPAEEPFWLMEQFARGSSVNGLTLTYAVDGDLDVAAMAAAWRATVARHEVLRTTYHAGEAEEPRRRVHPSCPSELEVLDLRAEADPDTVADDLTGRRSATGFDVARLPLLRAALLRVADRRYRLVLSFHHLVMDHHAVTRILLPELAQAYRAALAGAPPGWADEAVPYRRAVLAQRRWRAGPAAARQRDYWVERLADVVPLTLPTDRERPLTPTFDGATAVRRTGPGVAERLVRAGEVGATPFMATAAALAAVLADWSGATEVPLLGPCESRLDLESAATMGAFVNLVVLRFDLGGVTTGVELLEHARHVVSGAYAHQGWPAVEVLRSIGRESMITGAGGSAVTLNVFEADTGFRLDGASVGGGRIVPNPAASSDLEVSVLITSDGLVLDVKYRSALWDESTLDAFLARLEAALESVLTSPRAPVVVPAVPRAPDRPTDQR